LLESCGIVVLADGSSQLVRETLDKFSDVEFLETMREEHQYLMILLREYVSWYRSNEGKQIGAQMSIWEQQTEPLIEEIEFVKNFENVPYIGGNSIRGYLRRVMMYDYCKLVGVSKMNKDTYHQLFTGGNITDSTGFEDIAKREKYIEMCPAIGLLGSAIGNMTIEGEMKVIGARLRCKENGTGDLSFWQLIEQNFGTRLDSSKREKEIEIVNNTEQKSQMIYQYENFITGSIFDSAFVLTTTDELMLSAFWRMMKLWKENNFIGGNSARDSGMIEILMDIPENADAKYLEYISGKSEEIKEYFNA
jgi:CRISPR/Cas system CSM-associated protein Csm3 (group 7 of RAMP superfamily)